MGTIVAIESDGGVAIAGDTRAVDDRTVASERLGRVFDFGTIGAGVVGSASDIQEFRRRFEAELRAYRLEHDDDPDIETVARIAAREARGANVDAVVASRDSTGTARIREVGSDGHVLESATVALGSGAAIAFGQLDAVGSDLDVDAVASMGRDVIETVKERDVDTGGDVDVWSLATARSGPDPGTPSAP